MLAKSKRFDDKSNSGLLSRVVNENEVKSGPASEELKSGDY